MCLLFFWMNSTLETKPIALSFYFQVKNVFDRIIIYTLISYRYTYIHLNIKGAT